MPAELATSLTPANDAERLLQAESTVRDFCGWHIAPVRTGASETITAPCGRERIYLRTLQLTAITNLSAGTFDASHYDINTGQGWVQPKVGYSWPYVAPGRLTVTYSHGYATVPPSVTRAVQAIAQQGISNPAALRKIQAGPFVDEYASGAGGGGSIADVLAPYILPLA